LARLYSHDAVASDGHIAMPPWFPLTAIVLILAAGAAGSYGLIRTQRWRRERCRSR
jgi:hypothetical protein